MPTLKSLDWKWVMLGVLADLLVYVCHGWRWNVLLGPVIRLRLWRTVQAIYIGLFANEVLPLRPGEVIRTYLLCHWNDLRLSLGFASIAVERLIDGFWMLTAFFITAGFVKGIPKEITFLVQALTALLAVGTVVLYWIVHRRHEAHAAIAESRWSSTLRHVIEGLALMGNRRTLGVTMLISLLYLVLHIVSVYALMQAYRLNLSVFVAGAVIVIVRLATVIPNAPGNLGVFQASCVVALGLFSVDRDVATNFSFVMFFALTLPLLIGGAIATAVTGLNLGEIRQRARRSVVEGDNMPAAE
jgi:uncharacterized protein (TIRG00374 family)